MVYHPHNKSHVILCINRSSGVFTLDCACFLDWHQPNWQHCSKRFSFWHLATIYRGNYDISRHSRLHQRIKQDEVNTKYAEFFSANYAVLPNEEVAVCRNKCQCRHTSLVPAYEACHVYETMHAKRKREILLMNASKNS